MNRKLEQIIPFALALALALGSVVFSCVTTGGTKGAKPFYINAGPDETGRIATVLALKTIDKVILIDLTDRSRRTELASESWAYDAATTILSIKRELPYSSFVAHIEGLPEDPARFVLDGIPAGEDAFVVVEDRLGVPGFDYKLDSANASLVFRGDYDPATMKYYISYRTKGGRASIGNIDLETSDDLAYLEAKLRAEELAGVSATNFMDWFLDPDFPRGGKPTLVYRALSADERSTLMAEPVPVRKLRMSTKDSELSREVGFDARLPRSVELGSSLGDFLLASRLIEETSSGQSIDRALWASYAPRGAEGGSSSIEVELRSSPSTSAFHFDERFLIEKSIIAAGKPVELLRSWGIMSMGGDKPEAAILDSYSWREGEIFFALSCDDSRRSEAEALIRSIIAYRAQ